MRQEFAGVTVEPRAFLLRPDIPPEGLPRPEGGGELTGSLQQYAQEAGLTAMRHPSKTSFTRLALEVTCHAKAQGQWEPLHRALYRAYWEEGRDIGDLEVLREVAQAAALEWEPLAEALREGTYREQVEQEYQQARGLGISGIPAFVVGRFAFAGVQPYPFFRLVMQRALAEEATGGSGEPDL